MGEPDPGDHGVVRIRVVTSESVAGGEAPLIQPAPVLIEDRRKARLDGAVVEWFSDVAVGLLVRTKHVDVQVDLVEDHVMPDAFSAR